VRHALAVRGLTKRYGTRTALDRVDVAVPYGSIVCLVGPNGSGKTTLIECVEGLRRPDAGTIDILGDRYPYGQRRPARLGVQLQEESLPARIRVGEALEFFRAVYGARRWRPTRLAALGVDELLPRRFASLSGGQKRRVVVALALIGEPSLLVLDEPLAGLDPDGQAAVLDLLRLLRADGVTVLLSVHDLDLAGRLGDRLVMLAGGRVVADGRPADLVRGLGAPTVAVLADRAGLPAGVFATPGVRSAVRHAGRLYLFGGADLGSRLAAIGVAAEVRPVGLFEVYACGTETHA
jgi:ABC-2 type transport system ATP-binding protein